MCVDAKADRFTAGDEDEEQGAVSMQQFFSIGQLAQVMHTDESSVRMLLNSGILRAERYGNGYLVDTDEFAKFGIINASGKIRKTRHRSF